MADNVSVFGSMAWELKHFKTLQFIEDSQQGLNEVSSFGEPNPFVKASWSLTASAVATPTMVILVGHA